MSPSDLDTSVQWFLRVVGGLSLLLVGLIVGFVCFESSPAISRLELRLWYDEGWFPEEDASQGLFGVAPMVAGSMIVTAGAVLLATPVGLISAIFCEFYAPRYVSVFYRRLIELLAGIPSVVFGFWGLVLFAPLIAQWQPPGTSLLAGIVVVALMIMPTIMLMAQQSLASIPTSYYSGAAALGVGRWTFIRLIATKQARAGITIGILLAAARAIGETMAVVMVCGNVVKVPSSLFDPVRTLTANIALEMGYALGDHRSALFATALILLLVVALLLVLGQVVRRFSHVTVTAQGDIR